ncbi:hypothetical protein SAMN04489712_102578 [Thermomonospora echinospora]|uniref:DUF4351 domain-containing protein n=1 Tax=Thermomonospora echinospora TaxID=1992 RepID=A0A1H5W425_9ACTN|nr:hypothetical protein [Thermomonospora echinospora]SEF94133.1 hypothetical protein SAMN04489712_102578 [Thermomonospora echinospora]
MKTETREFLSDYTRTQVEQGRAEGKVEGIAEAILRLLAKRGIEVSAEVRDTVSGCTDMDQLDAWLLAAAKVDRAEDLLS